MNRILLMMILVVVTLNFISAIGVTPGKTTIIYPDGLDRMYSFSVLSESNEGYFLSIGGELGEYLVLERYLSSLYPYKEDSNKFSYRLNIPKSVLANMTPGEHSAEILIREKVDEEVFAVAVPSVIHKIVFFIPYPYKYLESRVEVLEADKNETTEFLIPIINYGEEEIESVYGEINIYNKQGTELLGNVTTNTASLESMERKDLGASWLNTVESDIYKAEINLIYDDEIATYYRYFKVGNIFIDVSDILIEDFELGIIVTFHIFVNNQWGEDLENIYASMKLYYGNGKIAYEVDSPVADIKAREKKRIPLYWDTTGVKKGAYNGELIVYYGDYKTEKTLYVEIFENDIRVQIQEGEFVLKPRGYTRLIFIISLIVLSAVAVFIFKKLTKRK